MRRLAVAAVTAALAFTAVALATDDGGERSEPAGAAGTPSAGTRRVRPARLRQLPPPERSGVVGPDRPGPGSEAAQPHARLADGEDPRARRVAVMPQDFGERTSDAELRALVEFLLAAGPS